MKIAIIRKKYNPFGGAERYLNLLASHLVREGHDVHIFANKWPGGTNNGVTFHKVPMIGGLSILKVWSFAVAAWVVLRRFDADIIFSNERLFSQDILRTSDGVHKTWLRIRMRYSSPFRRLSFIINPLHLSIRILDWHIFNRRAYRKIIAPSNFIKQNILSEYRNVRPDDITVIYNGVDLDRFHPANENKYRDLIRKQLGITETVKLLLFIGTGFERKGLRYAIESMQYLPANTFLAVIGKGSIKLYKEIAEKISVSDRVLFLGPVDDAERYYAASDILVAPTLYEPMANVILEALASGLPVVTTRDSGNSEVVSAGENGWLIDDPTDAEEIAERIRQTLDNAVTPIIKKTARKRAEEFTFDRTLRNMLSVICNR
ncbi:MAG: glycosyltransferase family 4 protein [Nitrospirae bacterium]|nr:glycosyltransferase family 4 protein [Nitrospirota bacterium]